MNVSGHRIGTAELENIINDHPKIIESAVVAIPETIKGEVPIAFIICNTDTFVAENEIEQELAQKIRSEIGGFAIPKAFIFVP